MRHLALSILLAAGLIGCAAAQSPPAKGETDVSSAPSSDAPALQWYKGNTHTHTLNSDGDSPPGEVAHWYRDHDYDFLVISDHNYYTLIDDLQTEINRENELRKKKPFLLIPGEEVSDGFRDPETKKGGPIHLNAIGSEKVVGAQGGDSVVEVLQHCIDAIHAAGGLAHVNHPNFGWALTADDLYTVENCKHVEVFNGHPYVHNFGGSGHPSMDELWDDLLSRGKLYYGLATDDAHHFQTWDPSKANPGRGWIVVHAPELSREAIVEAISNGQFYASTGVALDDVKMEDKTLTVSIHQEGSFGYRTQFFGKGGAVLAVDETTTPSYRLKSGDMYVRARVTDSGNRYAWSQPLFAEGALEK